MKPAGVGELQAAFEKMKEKLDAAGIFDDQYKKSIPSFPSTKSIPNEASNRNGIIPFFNFFSA